MATMEELEARLQRLQDIKDIERLQKIYGYYCDYFEYDKVVDLFSDNAESVEIADYGVYKGKKSIRRFYIELLQGGEGKEPRIRIAIHKHAGSRRCYCGARRNNRQGAMVRVHD